MTEPARENAKLGKVSIRLEGFDSPETANEYIRSFIKSELAVQLTSEPPRREGNAFVYERITCSWMGPPPYTNHCQGQGICA